MQDPGYVTTEQINTLIAAVQNVYAEWCATFPADAAEQAQARQFQAQALQLLYQLRRGSRRLAGRELTTLFTAALREWPAFFWELRGRRAGQQLLQAKNAQIAALTAENARLKAELERRPMTTSVEIPAQTVTVRSKVEQEILRLMAVTGLARSWRLVQRVLAAGLTDNANTVRNAFSHLKKQGHITDYTWNGKTQTWTPTAGGGRQMFRLRETGRYWAEQAFQLTAAPCELDAMVTRHKGVAHAVAILEARDHLIAAGYTVEAMPEPLLFDEAELWGARVEPDLVAQRKGARYLVEVQREIDGRNTEKWAKSLGLGETLLLITTNAQACEKQVAILREAIRRRELPAGEIYLASLEAMERGDWRWVVLRVA